MDWMSARGPEPKVTDDELLKTVEKTIEDSDCPVVGTREIALQVGMSGQRVRQRMEKLEERGEIRREKVGGGAVIYWPAGD